MWMLAWLAVEGAAIMVRAGGNELIFGHVEAGAASIRNMVKMLQAA